MAEFDTAAICAATALPELISRYVALESRGKESIGLCPFHSDTKPSLTVYEKNGQQRFKCFACGEFGNAIDFMMQIESIDFVAACKKLTNGDATTGATPQVKRVFKKSPARMTFKPPANCNAPAFAIKGKGEPVSIHPYLDAQIELLGYAAFYGDDPDPVYWTWGKYSEADIPKWERKGFTQPRTVYGLEQLARKPDAQVIITESEISADAAQELFPDFACISWPDGRHSYSFTDWSILVGKRVVLVPNADDAGRQGMARLAVKLYVVGVVEVKGVDVDTLTEGVELPVGWTLADAQDWTPDFALDWAKSRIVIYPPETVAQDLPDVALQQERLGSVLSDSLPPEHADVPPVEVYAHDALLGKVQLGVVDGNTVRKPRRQEIEPEADLPPKFSEDALADAFSAQMADVWRYTAAWSVWHKWDGSRWAEDQKKSVTFEARNLCRAIASNGNQLTRAGRQKITTLKTINSVLGLAGSDPRHAVAPQEWDGDPWLMGTPGGVLDLKAGKLIEADRAALISKCAGVTPARGEHPLWSAILARASGADSSFADYLQRWAGYMLTGDTREECFLFVHGAGGSGKSTFIKVLQDILGDYAISSPIESFTASDRKEHSTEIARLAGARLVIATETEEASRWNESRIKALTGRDKIAARKMHQNFFEFMPQFKLAFIGNHKPGLRSVGEEMKRRIHLVEFPGSIPEGERDRTLKDRITAEYPAIFQWMIDGCNAWQDYGLGRPEQVQTATDDYLQGEDTLGAWLDDCVDKQVGARTVSGEAYRSFRKWAESAGEYVPSQKRFSQRLEDRGFQRIKSGVRMFEGFTLKASNDTPAGSYAYKDD